MDQASSSGVEKESNDEKAGHAVLGKLKVVRVKRKREQAPIENLWLEVSDPPRKRHEPDISSLTLSPAQPPANTEASVSSKVLFRRLETVSPSDKTEASLYETVLQKVNERKHAYEKRKDQRENQKSKVQEHLHAAARDQHEALAKRARFEQVWKSRRDPAKAAAESELFQLYDVVRVDEESPDVLAKRETARKEAEAAQAALLRDYLPLLRDCLPEAAADLEQDLATTAPVEADDYVYDVYAVDEGFGDQEGGEEAFYPTVQIIDDEHFDMGGDVESEYDSQDSNDENNPLNDYPDEDDFGEFGDEKSDSDDSDDSGDFDPYASDDEEYDTVAYDNEQERRWQRRL
jgi:hypothetical protein